jgi:WD40 repeat protein
MIAGDLSVHSAATPIDARDLPAAWRRAERDAGDRPFALYGQDRSLFRVGLQPPAPFAQLSGATAIALTPDGERLAIGHGGRVRVYEPKSEALLWERLLGNSPIDAFVLPRRAPYLIACTRAGEVWVLDCDRGEPILHVADDDARAVALSPDDRTLAVAGLAVDLWSLPDGVRIGTLDLDVGAAIQAARAVDDALDGDDGDAVNEGVYAVGFAGDGEHVIGVRSRQGGELVIWNARTAARVAARPGIAVQRLVTSSTGTGALVRVHDEASVVRSVEVPTLRFRSVMVTGAEGLWDLRLTPDDRFLLAHDEETGLYVIDRASGEAHAWLDEFEACAYVVRNSRTAERARRRKDASSNDDTHVVALPRWGRNDPGAPISADGSRYAALRRHHDDRLVALFDLARCAPYAALAHAAPAVSAWLDGDGRLAATRDNEGRVYVWSLPDVSATLA